MKNSIVNIINKYDQIFANLITYIKTNSIEDLIFNLKNKIILLKHNNKNYYDCFINYLKEYKFWGIIDEENNNYENVINRITVIKDHLNDFIDLYNSFTDYYSKQILYALLLNWLVFDLNTLDRLHSNHSQYFDPNIFPSNKEDVFIDCGAYTGDTLISYINMYGRSYKKYYAYEMNKNSIDMMIQNININKIQNVIIKPYGVGDKNETKYINNLTKSASAFKLSDEGKEEIKIVKLDDDLDDIPTFIKMDLEGYEEKTLLGAKELISKYTPKLAIAVYHGYDQLWRVPKIIKEINPNYNYYLRFYGENLIPTEFVLYCKEK